VGHVCMILRGLRGRGARGKGAYCAYFAIVPILLCDGVLCRSISATIAAHVSQRKQWHQQQQQQRRLKQQVCIECSSNCRCSKQQQQFCIRCSVCRGGGAGGIGECCLLLCDGVCCRSVCASIAAFVIEQKQQRKQQRRQQYC
jgi:hypothetical protein